MQYQCPKCQSRKILPVTQANGPVTRPMVPKSLVILVPTILLFVILLIVNIGMSIFGNGSGQTLMFITLAVFIVAAIAGVMFWRDLPDFKISMQAFMQSQKKWKCRDCNHEWEN
ncbi:zinc-ribbon domain-containing protein [Acinetobacter shaoyimingii]|uniref:Zinc-ribbon domain-containing protein n=1 Tax=Acinetobacter shaoyimingii TaxID=2715164 RepID=A0A6G8RS37_9GAMM|nr:zinc-ribbon domain-containing protein [Acinetobacter shaoyimingii]NHB56777.1 zinc-ribbon domain-containing protein [Acinetobacter shaoyimingii]QIO04721.1 zinc-ribbon domain-containing protein [Acinetobacter shaoyimingii]